MAEKKFFYFWLGLKIGIIWFVPLIILAGGGKLLDDHFHTFPWCLVSGIFFAFILSLFLLFWFVLKPAKK